MYCVLIFFHLFVKDSHKRNKYPLNKLWKLNIYKWTKQTNIPSQGLLKLLWMVYSVDSIKRTVLLKVLLPKNARCVNTFPFSGNKSKTFEFKNISTHFVPYIRKYLGREILRTVYFSKNLYQKYCLLIVNSIVNREKSPWKAKCTVRLIESTEYYCSLWSYEGRY